MIEKGLPDETPKRKVNQRRHTAEEHLCQKERIKDMRKTAHNFENWSAPIPVRSLKGPKLAMEASSYLTCNTSLYTFIRKTRSSILCTAEAIDVNLMPPLKVRNCLPLEMTLHFEDSSGVKQTVHLDKGEEKSLYCVNMAQTVAADIDLKGFSTLKGFKLLNLERYSILEWALPLSDRYGRKTTIYTLNLRKTAGQKVIFHCKKLLVDAIDSELSFYYQRPKDNKLLPHMIPFVNLGIQRQKLYVIPEKLELDEIWAGLQGPDAKGNGLQRVDTFATSTRMDLCLKSASSRFNYSYYTDIYLAAPDEFIYTKITSVSPYYIVVNLSKKTIILEQSELPPSYGQTNEGYIPLILEPGARQAFSFFNFATQYFGQDEFLHIKVADERLKRSRGRELRKTYKWSCPFLISNVAKFSVRVAAQEISASNQKALSQASDKDEHTQLTKQLHEPAYLHIQCSTDAGGQTGNMFVIVRDEDEDKCEYKIVNKTKSVDLLYYQHIDRAKVPHRLSGLDSSKLLQKNRRLKAGQTYRYSWGSVLHEKILCISFTPTFKSYNRDKFSIALADQYAERRRLSKTDLVVPFDEIGIRDEIRLLQPAEGTDTKMASIPYGDIVLKVHTDGFTKILTIADKEDVERKEQLKRKALADEMLFLLPTDSKMKMRILKLNLEKVCISVIHRKQELLAWFLSRVQAVVEESQDFRIIKFSVGYLQIDNQADPLPAYAVILKPREMCFEDGQIKIQHEETEKEQQMREELGLDGFTAENARVFQAEIVINKSLNSKRVVYVERVAFLVQTLVIQVQFTHFLKVASLLYYLAEVLNKGVSKVHFVFVKDGDLQDPSCCSDSQTGASEGGDCFESASVRKQRRHILLKKYDNMVGSKIRALGALQFRQGGAEVLNIAESDWQFSESMFDESGRRIFIQSYQSSPIDLYVSVLNERLSKRAGKNKEEEAKHSHSGDELEALIANGLVQRGESGPDPEGDDIIGIFAARDQRFARRFLYFNTYEDMHFVMNGLSVNNLFGQSDAVISQLLTFHRETFKYNLLKLLGSNNLIGNPSRYVSNIGTGVSDFFVKPYQGMKNGGIARAADGFAQGSKSLFKNGLLAPVGAISKAGNSISKGALALSFDD